MQPDRPVIHGRDVTVLPEGLSSWRRQRGLTQEGLARLSGMSEGLIALIETGRRQPTYGNAVKLANALELPLRAFALVNADTEDEQPEAVAS